MMFFFWLAWKEKKEQPKSFFFIVSLLVLHSPVRVALIRLPKRFKKYCNHDLAFSLMQTLLVHKCYFIFEHDTHHWSSLYALKICACHAYT